MSKPTAPATAFLDAWFSQKPTCALMGEFSAGKSTLLNLLLSQTFLPTQVTATNMPVIWMTHADAPTAHALAHDGTLEKFDINALADQGNKAHLLLRLGLPAKILKRIDIIDTPGISDARLSADALNFLGPYLDCVIWCTAANQAWRQSEKAMWMSMPEGLRRTSILALTRADMITNTSDLAKVVHRCAQDAGKLFCNIKPISTTCALDAINQDGAIIDQNSWTESHADPLYEALEYSIECAAELCAKRDYIEAPEIREPIASTNTNTRKSIHQATKTVSLTKSKSGSKSKTIRKKSSKSTGVFELLGIISGLRSNVSETSPIGPTFNTLDHLFTTFLNDQELSKTHQLVLRRAMSLERSNDVSPEAVLIQLERELEDFANAPWCKLDQIH